MQKNVAGQIWVVYAYQDEGGTNPGEPVAGDSGNITANLRIDGGAANAVDDTNPTELEDGFYYFDITQAETNGECILIAPASSTANVNVVGAPAVVYTTPANFPDLGIETDGDVTKVNTLDGHTAQTGDSFARLGAPSGASVSADIATVDANVDAILVDTAEIGAAGVGLTEAGGTGNHLTDLATQASVDVIDGIVDDLKLGIILGAAATGTLSVSQCTSDLTGYANDQLIGRVITFTSGDAEGESTDITDYESTGGLLSFTALTTAPANGDTFKIT